jgi:hypothetical protein
MSQIGITVELVRAEDDALIVDRSGPIRFRLPLGVLVGAPAEVVRDAFAAKLRELADDIEHKTVIHTEREAIRREGEGDA